MLDLKLPGMDGMKVLEKIKEIDKDLSVIMLTGSGDIRDSVRAMKLGATDYLTKPFKTEELVLTIKKALQTQYSARYRKGHFSEKNIERDDRADRGRSN